MTEIVLNKQSTRLEILQFDRNILEVIKVQSKYHHKVLPKLLVKCKTSNCEHTATLRFDHYLRLHSKQKGYLCPRHKRELEEQSKVVVNCPFCNEPRTIQKDYYDKLVEKGILDKTCCLSCSATRTNMLLGRNVINAPKRFKRRKDGSLVINKCTVQPFVGETFVDRMYRCAKYTTCAHGMWDDSPESCVDWIGKLPWIGWTADGKGFELHRRFIEGSLDVFDGFEYGFSNADLEIPEHRISSGKPARSGLKY